MTPETNNAASLRLLWEDPSTGEPVEQVHLLPITIGRGSSNAIVLNSNRISREHARLEVENGRPIVRDLSSTNGTSLNGQRVTQSPLNDGDLIQIGPFSLTVDVFPFYDLAPAGQVTLTWADPETQEAFEKMQTLPITLGRDAQNNIVLSKGRVSRRHALIQQEGEQPVLLDQGSTNGTFVNGQRQARAILQSGDVIRIGDYELRVQLPTATPTQPDLGHTVALPDDHATLIFTEEDQLRPAPAGTPSLAPIPNFPPPAFTRPVVSIQELQSTGLAIEETTYLAIGGGVGSFCWVDHLRVFGVSASQITVLGLEEKPYGRYQRLCENSQIPSHERLRSDSGSTPDCLWGWPGYAVREIWGSLKQLEFRNLGRAAWQIFGEPTLVATYTPRSGDVFRAIDREAQRIGWDKMYRIGHVKAVRKTDDGRYVVAYTQMGPQGRRQQLIVARYLHMAVGYPGVRFLPDLQEYRQETGDFTRVVNAYEEHEHIYQHLRQHGGVVMVRGRGIVASRIIQRIYEMRQENPNIGMVLLLRSPLAAGNRYQRAQRKVQDHWEFQPFNWPKACWGGELREVLEQADDEKRDQLLNDWGGTTTADRQDWIRITEDGLREGWYQIRFGSVRKVTLNEEGKLLTQIRGKGPITEETQLSADFIIDCTGLQASLDFNPLLKDLAETYNLQRNPKERLSVANDFEVPGMRNDQGRMFASGAMTLGGPYAAVDSFLGLQFAALRSVDSLNAARSPGLRGLNTFRSTFQWLRWARGVQP